MSNSLVRDSLIGLDSLKVTDTYGQVYTLNWEQDISDRLVFSSAFKLTIDDTIVLDDVDTKTVVPTVELSLVNPVWDLYFDIEDKIKYSNEFNKRRSDAISSSLEANLFLLYMPVFKAKLDRLVNYQENLEDKVEEKLDATTSYTLGSAFNIDLSWKEIETDDTLASTLSREQTWNTTFSYARALTEAMKLDEVLSLNGTRTTADDLVSAISTSNEEHYFENKVKFTLIGFPGIDSSLELTNRRDHLKEKDTGNDRADYSINFTGGDTGGGTLKSSMNLAIENVADPDPSAQKSSISQKYTLEHGGTASKWLDYNAKYSLNLDDIDSGGSVEDQKTQENLFDLSVTGHPRDDTSVAFGFNHAAKYTNGIRTGTTRSFKLNLDYSDETTNVPGLIVSPAIEINNSWDRVGKTMTKEKSLLLDMEYTNPWPDLITLKLTPSYSWKKTEKEGLVRSLKVEYQLDAEFQLTRIDVVVGHGGTFNNTFSDDIVGGDFVLNKDVRLTLTPRFTGQFSSRLDYTYTIPEGSQPSDNTKVTLGYSYKRFYGTDVEFILENIRTFDGPKDVEREYTLKLNMTF